MTPPDQEHGDQFLRLFMEYEQALRTFVRSLLFSHEEQREVMQNVSVVLWRKFEPGMDNPTFCRWAFGVARMEVLTFRRDRARDRHVFSEDVSQILADTIQEQTDVLERERKALDGCIQKLPAPQLKVVQAVYVSGIKVEELALQLGKSAMAIYKNLHRCRLMLMDCTKAALATEELI